LERGREKWKERQGEGMKKESEKNEERERSEPPILPLTTLPDLLRIRVRLGFNIFGTYS
jgi:hypothetical protein